MPLPVGLWSRSGRGIRTHTEPGLNRLPTTNWARPPQEEGKGVEPSGFTLARYSTPVADHPALPSVVPSDGIKPPSPVCRTGALSLDEPGRVLRAGFEPAFSAVTRLHPFQTGPTKDGGEARNRTESARFARPARCLSYSSPWLWRRDSNSDSAGNNR